MSNKIVEVVTDKLDQLARDGLLATYGYSPFDAITRDKAGKLHVHTFPGVEAVEIIHYLEQYLRGEGIGSLEVYLVLDCRAGKGQGTTLTDVVAIIHCRARAYPHRI